MCCEPTWFHQYGMFWAIGLLTTTAVPIAASPLSPWKSALFEAGFVQAARFRMIYIYIYIYIIYLNLRYFLQPVRLTLANTEDDNIAVALGDWPLAPHATLWLISTFLPSSAWLIYDFGRKDRFATACQIHVISRARHKGVLGRQWLFASLHWSPLLPGDKPCITTLRRLCWMKTWNHVSYSLFSDCKHSTNLNKPLFSPNFVTLILNPFEAQMSQIQRTRWFPDRTSRMQYAVSCKGP